VNVLGAITGFWKACSARERVAVAAVVILVTGTALYLFLWKPGMAARKSLSEILPRLRAQLEDMRWQRDELAALRKKLGASSPPGDIAVVLRASAAQAPFAPAVERIESLSGGKARMQAGPLPFDAWLAWMENLQRELGIRLEACRVNALDQPGTVRLEAIFSGGRAQ
jgi:type II secretory pathway component PulM